MDIEHIYQRNWTYISEKLIFDTTVSMLFERGFIDKLTHENLTYGRKKKGPINATQNLIKEVLMRKDSPEDFQEFVAILHATNQHIMADVLQREHEKSWQPTKHAENTTEEELKTPMQVSSASSGGQATNNPEQDTVPKRVGVSVNPNNPALHQVATAAGLSHRRSLPPEDQLQDPDLSYLQISGANPSDVSSRPADCDRQESTPLVLEIDVKEIKIDRNNLIGTGHFGNVYSCKWKSTPVAVKQVKSETTTAYETKMNKEIIASAMATHPSIVKFFGYSYDKIGKDRFLLLVYECIEGHDLNQVLNYQSTSEQYQLTESRKYKVACELAEGIDFLHGEKMIHGDIKPANIMIGKGYQVKICDLGFIILLDAQAFISSRAYRGTPLFQEPQMYDAEGKLYYHSDIYSLGATLYNIHFGENMWGKNIEKQPDKAKTLEHKIKKGELPQKLQNPSTPLLKLIADCLQFEPTQRPKIQEVLRRLKELQGGIHE